MRERHWLGRRGARVVVLGLAAALVLHAGVAKAQPYTLVWQTSGGSWPISNNWYDSGAVVFQIPTSVDDAIINSGDAAIRNADCQAYNLILGNTSGSSGIVAWRAGNTRDLHVYNDLTVGNEGTSYVRMFLGQADGHTLDVDRYLYVGRSGSARGYFTQEAGTVNVFRALYVANSSGTRGTYTISGDAELTIDGYDGNRYLYVGVSGDAEFNQDGGTVTVGRYLRVAEGSASDSTYTMTAGLLDLTPGYSIIIGRHGDGHFVQSGGTVEGPSNQGIYLGFDPGATGEWRLSGTGHVDAGGFLRVGCHAEGDFIQTGGSVDVPRDAVLGYSSDGDGVYEISGGTLDVDGSLIVGNAGTGVFKIIGDAATIDVDGYTQGAGGTLELDINGISPINVEGAVALAGALDVEFIETPLAGQEFLIIDNDGTDTVAGIFAGMGEGAAFMVQGFDCTVLISYEGGTGNDVVLTTTPEPTTLTLLGLGALGLLARRRRK